MYKKFLHTIIALVFLVQNISAQSNCGNPTQITLCPDTTLYNQSTLGMLDDAPAGINIVGEDVVYQLNVPASVKRILVSIGGANTNFRVSLYKGSCNSNLIATNIYSWGSSHLSYNATGSSTFFLWLDAAATLNYSISFGMDTVATIVNVPNTKGVLKFDTTSCGTPFFMPAKPYFNLTYNGVYQFDPMTLSPLNHHGTMCISTYFQNTSGIEAIIQFKFKFDSLGYQSVSAPDSVPGFYKPGYWIKSQLNNTITYNFKDSLNTASGDFVPTHPLCNQYKFCFDIVPVSNNPAITKIRLDMLGDGKGTGYTAWLHQGCCPGLNPNCHGIGYGGVAGAGTGFGFGVADPGNGGLPIELNVFEAKAGIDVVNLYWETATEVNNDYFTIERSVTGEEWLALKNIEGAGNSSNTKRYNYYDEKPLSGVSYYRLKQTDYDGHSSYSQTKAVRMHLESDFITYPNPAADKLIVDNNKGADFTISLINEIGQMMDVKVSGNNYQKVIDTSELANGVYLMIIQTKENVISKRIVSVYH